MQRTLLLAFLSLAALFPGSGRAQNIMVNAGFENGDFSGWQGIWNYGEPPNFENWWQITSSNVHTGHFAAELTVDGGYQQTVGITAGQTYNFSGATFVPSGGDPSGWSTYVRLDFLNSTGQVVGSSYSVAANLKPRDQWNTFSTSLLAPTGSIQARVQMATSANFTVNPAAPVAFDSFSLSLASVPEPGSVALWILGTLGLAGADRRRVNRP
ncbi:MAG: hypothetical protein JO317_06335 [Verrucomicrobiae bacterium]|nr:hypothetical protein [Verrucomicrobiae bacterium]